MKIYFNSSFIEKDRITDDNWIKGNNGNKLEAFFEDLDLSNVNITLRLVIGWSNGETTAELPMNKSYNNQYAYINLPTLRESGVAEFTIKIHQNDTLLQTAIFTRTIKESVNASDDPHINSAEYEALLSRLDALEGRVGLPIEVYTEEEMNALLIEKNIGKIYKYIGTTGVYTNGGLYQVVIE